MSHGIDAFYAAAAAAPERGLGQLDPAFQRALAEYHLGLTAEACEFHHAAVLPDGQVLAGAWDLRGHEDAYLGGLDVAGRRVLELGAANGGLTWHMARAGARVVAFDVPPGRTLELVPHPGVDLARVAAASAQSVARIRGGWWFLRRALGLEAAAVYGDFSALPSDLGEFDVAVFGLLLLHLSNPFRALQQAAAITREAIVVTDVAQAAEAPVAQMAGFQYPAAFAAPMVFAPTRPPAGIFHWWGLSAGAVAHMLSLLGFGETRITTHRPERMPDAPDLFTVVAMRTSGAVAMPTVRAADAAAPAAGPEVAREAASDGLPLPPPWARLLTSGTDDPEVFLRLGARAHAALLDSLAAAGTEPRTLGRILDFGCGAGRVMRYWRGFEGVELHGSDIVGDAVAWAAGALPFARFATNPLAGPLGYEDGMFGLVYALSVFTHLPVAMQRPWMVELLRVLRPGGLLYLTTHGDYYQRHLGDEQRAAFARGEPVVVEAARAGSNWCGAYHPPSWMERLIASCDAERVEFVARGARGNPEQDSWLVRKRG